MAAAFLALGGSNLDHECEQRRRAWPVNLMVKAPFPPFPVLFLHGCCVLGARVYVTLTLTANGGVDARGRAWPVNLMVKAPFPHFSFSFFTAAEFSELGVTWPCFGERDLDRECERRRRRLKKQSKRTAASTLGVDTRERDGESSPIPCLRSRWRSQLLSPRLLRSRRSGELDLDRECERRRRRLKKQTFHRLASYAEVLQYNG